MCINVTQTGNGETRRILLTICMGSSCFTRGNSDHLPVIQQYLKEHRLEEKVQLKGSRCDGCCAHGPNLRIDGELVHDVSAKDLPRILARALAPFLAPLPAQEL